VLTAFIQAFRTPDLRKKLLFTIGIIGLFRFGSNLPTPGISEKNVIYCSGLASSSGGSGASLYLTVGLAVMQCAGYVEWARSGALFSGTSCSATSHPLIPDPSLSTIATMVITMTSGTAVIMWMGELITDRGIGNGMSVMIFTTVIAVIPGELGQIYLVRHFFYALMAVVVVILVIWFVVFMEQAQRRVPVQYSKRMIGRRMYGGTSTYIPMKVNQAGVVPIIFASSLLYIPQLAASLFGSKNHPQG
jgi:preprotein translocase subunit SecY